LAGLWIGFEEAEQLQELLEGIAADEHAASSARVLARSAAERIEPRMPDGDLADIARLLADAADSTGLDTTWREGAHYWAGQLDEWLRPPAGGH
jgi:hypothetical protein